MTGLDLAATRARAVAARELVTRLKRAGNITDVGGAEALYIVIGDLEATLSRLESADRLHRADHARVAELERRLARAMGAIAAYDRAFGCLGGTNDEMDDAEADGKALLAAYAKDHPLAPAPAADGTGGGARG